MVILKKKIKLNCLSDAIVTDRLILRKFKLSDCDDIFNNYANDERVTKFLTWDPHGDIKVTKNKVKEWVKSYKNENIYSWAIVHKELGQVIGSIALAKEIDSGQYGEEPMSTYEVGYALAFDCWGQGIMTEALGAVIKYLFTKQTVKRVLGRHLEINASSGKVLLNAGMEYLYSYEGKLGAKGGNYTIRMYKIEKQ